MVIVIVFIVIIVVVVAVFRRSMSDVRREPDLLFSRHNAVRNIAPSEANAVK